MGLSEISLSTILKPFECLTHCKFTARSPHVNGVVVRILVRAL